MAERPNLNNPENLGPSMRDFVDSISSANLKPETSVKHGLALLPQDSEPRKAQIVKTVDGNVYVLYKQGSFNTGSDVKTAHVIFGKVTEVKENVHRVDEAVRIAYMADGVDGGNTLGEVEHFSPNDVVRGEEAVVRSEKLLVDLTSKI